MRLLLMFLLFLALPGWRSATAQSRPAPADLVAAERAAARPNSAPRFIVDLTTANRNAYLMRASDAADDHGYLGIQLTYQTRSGLFAGTYLNSSYGPEQPLFDDYEGTLGYAHAGHSPTE